MFRTTTMNCGTGYGFYLYSAPLQVALDLIVENNTINAGLRYLCFVFRITSPTLSLRAASIKKNNIS